MSRPGPSPWCIYYLIDPRDNVPFYVGCSSYPYERVKAHHRDPLSCAWLRCQQILADGKAAHVSEIAWFWDWKTALKFESQMIRETETAENLTRHPAGCKCRWHDGIMTRQFHNDMVSA